jgi:hypothetical protein
MYVVIGSLLNTNIAIFFKKLLNLRDQPLCMYVYMYVCMYVFTYVRTYVCMYVRMYVCMCVSM